MSEVGKRIYRRLSSAPVWMLLVLVALWSLPTVSLWVDSLRTRVDQRRSGFWTAAADPDALTLDNYATVLDRTSTDSLHDALISSFSIAIPATIIPIFFGAAAAYAFAFIEFKGREWLFIAAFRCWRSRFK